MPAVQKNSLYYCDNLTVLREHIKDESVDLIYLDPPFNSRQDYNVLFAEKDAMRPIRKLLRRVRRRRSRCRWRGLRWRTMGHFELRQGWTHARRDSRGRLTPRRAIR